MSAHPAWRALLLGGLLSVGGLAERAGGEEDSLAARPTGAGAPVAAAGTPRGTKVPCLCSFDVERTLLAAQTRGDSCPEIRGGTADVALSHAAQSLGSTGCSGCYLAIVGSGEVGGEGSTLRGKLVQLLGDSGKLLSKEWRSCASGNKSQGSSLLAGCRDGTKQEAVLGILAWLRSAQGVHISEARAWHFDDQEANVLGFHGTGLNARQVSCKSRDAQLGGEIGLCGAAPDEIALEAGISRCPGGLGALEDSPDGEGVEHLSSEADGTYPAFEEFQGLFAEDGAGAESLMGPKLLGADGCKQWCAEQRACECATLEQATDHCWLKRQCSSRGWAASPAHTVFWKVRTGDSARPDPQFKVAYARSDLNLGDGEELRLRAQVGVSFEACEAWCSQTPGCGCAVYLELQQTCHLREECRHSKSSSGSGAAPESGGAGKLPSAKSMSRYDEVEISAKKISPEGRAGTHAGSATATLLEEEDRQGLAAVARARSGGGDLPEGTSIRVTKALGSRGYNKVRVSLVTCPGDGGGSGSTTWTYSAKFEHKWTNCYIKSAIVDAKPGQKTSVDVDGESIDVKLPKEDEGVQILLMADPCLGCKGSEVYTDITGMTNDLINQMAEKGELDYWVTIGDNWYDITGEHHNLLWSGFSKAAMSIFFGATLGNHDFWIESSPEKARDDDSYGFGHTQWYGMDSMAAKDDEAKPFDLSTSPPEVVPVSNTFWYHTIGNVALIGFANNYDWGSVEGYFTEACSFIGESKAKFTLLLAHWSYGHDGTEADMTTDQVYQKVSGLSGCSDIPMRYALGHTHENHIMGDNNGFMVGAWGFGGGKQDGSLGIPILSTKENKAVLHYWKLGVGGEKLGSYDETLECLQSKGVSGCTDLDSHETWMEESI